MSRHTSSDVPLQGGPRDPSSALPWQRWNQEISISGRQCVGVWMLALLLNGLALAKGWQAPPSWLAWGLDEWVAGALLGGWLLLTWWRQQRLWLVGALLLVGALWLASWL